MEFIIEEHDRDDPALQADEKYQFAKGIYKDHPPHRVVNKREGVVIYEKEAVSLSAAEMGFEPGRLIIFHHDEYAILHHYVRDEQVGGSYIDHLIIMNIEKSPCFDLSKEKVEEFIKKGMSFLSEFRYKLDSSVQFEYWNKNSSRNESLSNE